MADASPLYVAPTEPLELRKLGVSTLLPEQYGVDFYWESTMGKCGVQRKQFPGDFLASVHDGRLNREFPMMKGLDLAILLLEGKGNWTTDGRLIREYGGKRWAWSLSQHRNYCASVQLRGIQVHTSDSIRDTAQFIDSVRVWSNKADHHSLTGRPGPKASGGYWANVSNRDWQEHVLTCFPDVGAKKAKAILDTVGFPFGLSVSKEDMLKVPGWGKKGVDKFMKVFSSDE